MFEGSSGMKLLGQAELIGKTVWLRLSRKADPKRRRLRLDEVIVDVLQERMSEIPELALAQGRKVAHEMSLKALELRAAPTMQGPPGETVSLYATRWRADRLRLAIVVSDESDRCSLGVHILPIIGHRRVVDVTRMEIEQIVGHLDDLILKGERGEDGGISWKRAANVWWTLCALFRDAAHSKPSRNLRVRSDDPTSDVAPPKRGEKRVKAFLYPSEYLQLVTAPAIWDTTGRNALVGRNARRWMRLFTLAIYMHLRGGELRVLRWEHLDLDHWVITVKLAAVPHTSGKREKGTKGGEVRSFEIPEQLRPLLLAMREEAGGDKAQGRIMRLPPEKDIATRLRRYCELAGLKRADLYTNDARQAPLTFHDLRATGITWRAKRGDNPFAIQDAAGHADLKTTQLYIRRAAALGEAFGTPFPPVPAIVLGSVDLADPGTGQPGTDSASSAAAVEPASASQASAGSAAQPGPELAQETVKATKGQRNRSTGRWPHHDGALETPVICEHPGPSDPSNATDRSASHQPDGLRAELERAILTGDVAGAVQLAARLAAQVTSRRSA